MNEDHIIGLEGHLMVLLMIVMMKSVENADHLVEDRPKVVMVVGVGTKNIGGAVDKEEQLEKVATMTNIDDADHDGQMMVNGNIAVDLFLNLNANIVLVRNGVPYLCQNVVREKFENLGHQMKVTTKRDDVEW